MLHLKHLAIHSFVWLWLLTACVPPPETAVLQNTPTPIPLLPSATPFGTATAVSTQTTPPEPEPERITIPLVIYILDDEMGQLSSQRTTEDIETIIANSNEIWAQADIELNLTHTERVTVPQQVLIGINGRDFFSFFDAVNRGEVPLTEFAPIVGFYTQTLGGPNGIAPTSSNTFFVMDTPSVHDERVTSHEIGHILGLHHVLDDPNRLLYSGTNGTNLSSEEIAVARYSATGLLSGVR